MGIVCERKESKESPEDNWNLLCCTWSGNTSKYKIEWEEEMVIMGKNQCVMFRVQ